MFQNNEAIETRWFGEDSKKAMTGGFKCGDPSVLADQVRGIIEKVSGGPEILYRRYQAVEYFDTAYGQQVLVSMGWVSRELQDAGGQDVLVDRKVIRMLGHHTNKGKPPEFYVHQNGIHLHQHLKRMPDEGHIQGV